MFAVIKTGGKQYSVAAGDVITVMALDGAELGCRMKQALAARQVRWIPGKGTASVAAVAAAAEGLAGLSMPELHGRIDPDVVREILRGERFTLSADPAVLKLHEARLRGKSFASIAPAGAGCDIRQVWEPARLQHVTLLVAAVRNGCGESRDIARFARESAGDSVMRWIDRNPFPKGPHHASAMECGLRVPVFFYCLKELAGRDAADREILLESIHRHAWWISRRLSLHSSLGNHTIAEGVGLIFAGAVFRESRAGRQWLKTGCALLEEELPHQVLADGGPAEQAFAYHRFVLDLYWLAVDFSRGTGCVTAPDGSRSCGAERRSSRRSGTRSRRSATRTAGSPWRRAWLRGGKPRLRPRPSAGSPRAATGSG